MWKIGFFKRRRPDHTLSGNLQKHKDDNPENEALVKHSTNLHWNVMLNITLFHIVGNNNESLILVVKKKKKSYLIIYLFIYMSFKKCHIVYVEESHAFSPLRAYYCKFHTIFLIDNWWLKNQFTVLKKLQSNRIIIDMDECMID